MTGEKQTNDPTANWRKYAKGPNFLGIVIAAMAVMILMMIGAYLFLRADAKKLLPHQPNPTPNSRLESLPRLIPYDYCA
jgi:hypothetical protein